MRSKIWALLAAGAATVGASAGTQAGAQAGAQAPSESYYARYSSAARCAQSIPRMLAYYWRDRHADSVRFAPDTDTLPTIVRDSARLCAARVAAAPVAASDLLPLVQLYLGAGDTAAASATMARLQQASAGMPALERSRTLSGVVSALLAARPAQFARARGYGRALDALGGAGAEARLAAHTALAQFAWGTGALAAADSESKAALVAGAELSRGAQMNQVVGLLDAYMLRSRVLRLRQGRAPAEGVLDTASAILLPLTQSGGPNDAAMRYKVEQKIATLRQAMTADGVAAKPVRGDVWFGVAGDSTFPRRGRVLLALPGTAAAITQEMMGTIRRLHAEFGAKGLDIVIMSHTTGYFQAHLTSTVEDEEREFKQWFLDHWRLPVIIAVEESQFSRQQDGRRVNSVMANETNYGGFGPNAVLIGKDGTIRIALDLDDRRQNEQMYRQQIAAALAQ